VRLVRQRTRLSEIVDNKTKRPRLESHEALRPTALPQGLLNLNLSSSRISVNHYGIRSEYACTVTSVCRGSRALTSPCRFPALNMDSSHQANLEGLKFSISSLFLYERQFTFQFCTKIGLGGRDVDRLSDFAPYPIVEPPPPKPLRSDPHALVANLILPSDGPSKLARPRKQLFVASQPAVWVHFDIWPKMTQYNRVAGTRRPRMSGVAKSSYCRTNLPVHCEVKGHAALHEFSAVSADSKQTARCWLVLI
jgi:hypothetical protein